MQHEREERKAFLKLDQMEPINFASYLQRLTLMTFFRACRHRRVLNIDFYGTLHFAREENVFRFDALRREIGQREDDRDTARLSPPINAFECATFFWTTGFTWQIERSSSSHSTNVVKKRERIQFCGRCKMGSEATKTFWYGFQLMHLSRKNECKKVLRWMRLFWRRVFHHWELDEVHFQ